MPYLRLQDLATGKPLELKQPEVRLGRDPTNDIVVSGSAAKVASGDHAVVVYQGDRWILRDRGSRNGTYLNGTRISGYAPLRPGDKFTLGETGPAYRVEAVAERSMEATVVEAPAIALAPTQIDTPAIPAEVKPASRAYSVILRQTKSGRQFMAQGARVRLGRGKECEVQPVASEDTTVSRIHAELTIGKDGHFAVHDAGSKNGTFVNGQRILQPMPIKLGDRIMLGEGGPELLVEGIGTAPSMPAVKRPGAGSAGAPTTPPGQAGLGPKTVMGMIGQALAEARQERRRGGRASEGFVREVAQQVSRQSRWRVILAVVALFLLVGGGIGFTWWYFSLEAEETQLALEADRAAAESVRVSAIAEAARLRNELEQARAAAAPAAQVESLRAQMLSAQARTSALEEALSRAQEALQQQLRQGERMRAESQEDVRRLRDQLAEAERRSPNQAVLDSLRRAVQQAERQAASVDARLRAIRGTDFGTIAQQTQGAVGLITAAFGRDLYDGTGFVVSPDGYMLTNWHVVADSSHAQPDTLWVTMADQATAYYADVIAVSAARDLALIKLRRYKGSFIASVDWQGTKARQGEPAALIGFPAGSGFARYRSTVVRTSMTAGIISRVTEDLVQFDGMTIGGSSGSPVFNGNGEIIAVHRAGLRETPGFALAVPVKHALALFPLDLKAALGIQ